MSTIVLQREDADYTRLTEFGRIVIQRRPNGSVEITSEGFCADNVSCRDIAVMSAAWARDVLAAAVETNRLIPGGGITLVVD